MDNNRANSADRTRNGKAGLRNKRRKTVHEHVSKGAIKRLARRGGVKRLSALIYNESRTILREYLETLVRDSILYCEYFKRKTVQAQDVVRAIRKRGQRLYGFDDPASHITIRTSITLNDTPEESIPSTLEQTETPESETNAGDSEVPDENNATTSRRLSENLSDSDATLSDIALPTKRGRIYRSFSNDGEHIPNEDSDESDSLISPGENKTSPIRENRRFLETSLENSEAPNETISSDARTKKTRLYSDDLESTEENNSVSPKKRNKVESNISKNYLQNADDQNHTPSTRNAGINTRESLNVRRRKLFPHTRSSDQALRNLDQTAENANKGKSSTVITSDSDDFQNNLDFLSKKNRRNSRNSTSTSKSEIPVRKDASNANNPDTAIEKSALNAENRKNVKQNSNAATWLEDPRNNDEMEQDDPEISVVYLSLPAGKFSKQTK